MKFLISQDEFLYERLEFVDILIFLLDILPRIKSFAAD